MAVQEVILETKPAGPVEYNEKAVLKVFEETGYVIADTKEDGVQLNLTVKMVNAGEASGCGVSFLSRAGKILPAIQRAYLDCPATMWFTKILEDDCCIYPKGFMLQAEIVTPGFPAEITAGNLRRKSKALDLSTTEIHVFGVVPIETIESGADHDVTHGVMKYHVEAITGLLQKHVPQITWKVCESVDVFTPEELQRIYGIRREQGKEGLVVKDPNAIWKRGKKVGQWKMKPEDTIDGKVIGLLWGTPGLANEGKVIGFEVLLEDGHVVNACGLTKEQMEEFTTSVHESSEGGAFPQMGWTVEVGFMERFKDGSLRHPSFSRWRGISEPTIKE